MTQVKIQLIGTTRQAVEEALAHLQLTASLEGQRWAHPVHLHEWKLTATLVLPAGSQPAPSESARRPILVEELGLPTLTCNALLRSNIKTVEALLAMPEEQLRSVHNLGEKSFLAIVDSLKRHGLYASSALAQTW
jgi:DNA-directed RNA polymerase alpha subunit